MIYYRQSDDFACGPIAAGNALKHLGLISGFSRVRNEYIERLGCDRLRGGTPPKQFHKGLCHLHPNLVVIKRNAPSKTEFNEYLSKGYGAIVRFSWANIYFFDCYHYAYIEPRDGGRWYNTANFHGGGTAFKKLTSRTINEHLFGRTHDKLQVWFVRKK